LYQQVNQNIKRFQLVVQSPLLELLQELLLLLELLQELLLLGLPQLELLLCLLQELLLLLEPLQVQALQQLLLL
jgi:hypothetical protein